MSPHPRPASHYIIRDYAERRREERTRARIRAAAWLLTGASLGALMPYATCPTAAVLAVGATPGLLAVAGLLTATALGMLLVRRV